MNAHANTSVDLLLPGSFRGDDRDLVPTGTFH